MKVIRRGGLAATAVAVALLGAACSNGDDSDAGTSPSVTEPGDVSSSGPSSMPSTEPATPDAAMADLVGTGCAGYAETVPTGAGSVDGMAQDPVATAASNNPILTTLTAAVSGQLNPGVNLVDTLNGGEFTVFAPVDDAFAKIDAATINTLKTDKDLLSKILTYHVVPGQIAPDAIDGDHPTAEGEMLTVTGSGNDIMINGASAVICGGVHTANATVYLIDTVLMPPSMTP